MRRDSEALGWLAPPFALALIAGLLWLGSLLGGVGEYRRGFLAGEAHAWREVACEIERLDREGRW